jgi:chromosome partitioning protein
MMPVVVVANPKGGVGKSTLSTNVAGFFASQGHKVMLGDADRQQSSRLWLGLRPETARPIVSWDVGEDKLAKLPKGTTHVVLDTPAGLKGARMKDVLQHADKVLVPLQPSVFDIFATRTFLDELRQHAHKGMQVGIVGLPVLAYLRDTQNYIHLAAHGLTLFDVAPSRVEKDLEQWQGLCRWLDK